MGHTSSWDTSPVRDGVVHVKLDSWRDFADYVSSQLVDYKKYIYRGQASADWPLLPKLDRSLGGETKANALTIRRRHLEHFMSAAQGRRGASPVTIDANAWWSLGSHYGLNTPLLDWTESPFVALYFAFDSQGTDSATERVVSCLSSGFVSAKTMALKMEYKAAMLEYESQHGKPSFRNALNQRSVQRLTEIGSQQCAAASNEMPPDEPATLEIIRPQIEENARLVSQRGLFTLAPPVVSVEEWIKATFSHQDGLPILTHIRIADGGREDCLKFLSRMNINHLSLFPDLFGACMYCNRELDIENY